MNTIASLSNNLPTFFQGLKLMGFGMTGIFLVLLLLFALVKVLIKLFPPKTQ
ncbi:OadG-related small transporter subunit [Fonticella tunisiensis]|uniref:OadG-related small transporter subunit n=1 Tax=Fonticella tunisiensis TaxID=1096341 RepID=UPI003C12BB96